MDEMQYVPPNVDPSAVWDLLTRESGCAVFVVTPDGDIVYANQRSRDWMRARRAASGGEAGPPAFEDTCSPVLRDERLNIIRRVCERSETVVYESINRSVRHLISLRPIRLPNGGGAAALCLARRLRPWERITPETYPDATVLDVDRHDSGVLATLSPRELDVLILIGEGLSSNDIAQRLHRSVRTIERHRDRLGQKLGVSNRVEIARFAIRAGLAELPEPADAVALERKPHDPLAISEPMRRVARKRTRKVD